LAKVFEAIPVRSGRVSGYSSRGRSARQTTQPRSTAANPLILLSRLVIDREHQGCGLGENLLGDAVARAVQVAEQIGVRAILVHALHDQARSFYTPLQLRTVPHRPTALDAAEQRRSDERRGSRSSGWAIPKTHLRSRGPFQVFAASVTQARGYDVDKPRNLEVCHRRVAANSCT
jgi:hypothetical protein